MKKRSWIWGLALVLAVAGFGCKQQESATAAEIAEEPGADQATVVEPADQATVPASLSATSGRESMAQATAVPTVTLEGILTYQDLEGGLWQIQTETGVFVLRNASGCREVPERANEAQARKVRVSGHYASSEGNIGIHMAGPYFEVEHLTVLPEK